jgi:hypothetical protein
MSSHNDEVIPDEMPQTSYHVDSDDELIDQGSVLIVKKSNKRTFIDDLSLKNALIVLKSLLFKEEAFVGNYSILSMF